MAERLSTRLTLFWLIFVYGMSGCFACLTIYYVAIAAFSNSPPYSVSELLKIILFIDLGCGFMLVMCGSLKSVSINGDLLIVSNYFKEIRIPISSIDAVSGPDISSLRRITLRLKEPTEFGVKIVFTAGFFPGKNVANRLRREVIDVKKRNSISQDLQSQ
jgi:hypothetical protein